MVGTSPTLTQTARENLGPGQSFGRKSASFPIG
jgi:hypothetical protein